MYKICSEKGTSFGEVRVVGMMRKIGVYRGDGCDGLEDGVWCTVQVREGIILCGCV